MEDRHPRSGWSGWRRASRSCSAATGSPGPRGPGRGLPARRPAGRGAGHRRPAARSRRPTTRWSTRPSALPTRRSWRWAVLPDEAISAFFDAFARRLEDDAVFAPHRRRPTPPTSPRPGRGGAARPGWCCRPRCAPTWWPACGPGATRRRAATQLVERVEHGGWRGRAAAGRRSASSGFVFEGRPERVRRRHRRAAERQHGRVPHRQRRAGHRAWRSTSTRSRPALAEAGLPPGAAALLAAPSRAAGWALFSHPRAGAGRGARLGRGRRRSSARVARQAGMPVSLHGTGGAWLVAGVGADAGRFEAAVRHSLDRKVCNTLNVCCIVNGARRGPRAAVPRRASRPRASGGARRPSSTWSRASEAYVPAELVRPARSSVRARPRARAASRRPSRRRRPSSAGSGSGRRAPR